MRNFSFVQGDWRCRNDKESSLNVFDIHFVFMLSTDFKYQLMTSVCLQMTRILYGNIAVS